MEVDFVTTQLLSDRQHSQVSVTLSGSNSRLAVVHEVMAAITVYGADWCPLTKRSLAYLDAKGVDYEYVDIEDDPEAAKWVAGQSNGKEKKPTIKIDGQVLVEPSNQELERALARA